MQIRWLAIPALILPATLAQADVSRLWVAHHDGPGNQDDRGNLSAVDSRGNLYVVGETTNPLGVAEILLVKLDATGTKHWSRTYASPGGGPDYGFVVAVDPQDDVIVVGDSVGANGDYDLVVLKYGPQGELVWAQRYDGPAGGYDGTSAGLSLDIDSSGCVHVGGYSEGLGTDVDSIVLKYSPQGVLLWEARYDGPTSSVDYTYGLRLDSAGNVCVAGETPDASGGADYLVLKYDPNGNLLWQRQYDGPAHGSDYVYMLAVGPSDELVVTGSSPGIGTRDDVATVKYDANGNLEWARRYDGPASHTDLAFAVAVGPDGQVAVAGRVGNAYDSSALTLLYAADGTPLWARSHDASLHYYGDDTAADVALDAAGDVWVVGSGWIGPEAGFDVFVLRYSADGTQTFAHGYDGEVHGDDVASRIVLRGDELFVSGSSQRGERRLDVLALKYGPAPPFRAVPAAIQLGSSPAPLAPALPEGARRASGVPVTRARR